MWTAPICKNFDVALRKLAPICPASVRGLKAAWAKMVSALLVPTSRDGLVTPLGFSEYPAIRTVSGRATSNFLQGSYGFWLPPIGGRQTAAIK